MGQQSPKHLGERLSVEIQASFPSHHLRVYDGCGTYNLRGSHPEIDHVLKFLCLCTVGKGAYASPEGNFHACGDGASEVWFGYFGHGMAAVLFGVVLAVQLVVVEGWNKVDSFGLELLDVVIGEFHAVFDRVHASGKTVAQSFSSDGMTRTLVTFIVRLFDERPDFFERERWGHDHLTVGCNA